MQGDMIFGLIQMFRGLVGENLFLIKRQILGYGRCSLFCFYLPMIIFKFPDDLCPAVLDEPVSLLKCNRNSFHILLFTKMYI